MIIFGELVPGQGVTMQTLTNVVNAVSDDPPSVIIKTEDIIYSTVLYSQGALIIDEPNPTLSLVS